MPDYSDFEYHRVQRIFYRMARGLAVAAVVVAPWLFGSAEPWAYLFVSMLAQLSLGIFFLSKVCFPERRVIASSAVVALVVLLILLFMQVVPLPRLMASFFSAVSVGAVEARDALFGEMGASEAFAGNTMKATLYYVSSAPTETFRAIFLFVGYLAVYIVLSNTVRSWKHIQQISSVIIVSSFLMVVLSLVHKFSGIAPLKIFWFHLPRYPGDVMGPFTNRNHFAFHMLMVFGITLGMFGSMMPRKTKMVMSDWRERLAWIDPKAASQAVLIGFALCLFGASIFISLSRGAVVSLLASAGIIWVILSRSKDGAGGRMLLWAVMSMVIAVVVWIGWEAVLGRMMSLAAEIDDPLNNTRAVVARDTLLILRDHLFLGCGFGCFKHVFPFYQGTSLGSGIFMHAHNDWAQMLAEGGLLCSAAFVSALILMFHSVVRHYPHAIRRARRYVMGLLMGIIAVMLHSFLDYSLHKPGNAFMLSAMCGLMVASVHMSAVWDVERGAEGEEFKLQAGNWSVKARIVPFFALITLSILVSMNLSCLRRAVAFERFGYISRLVDKLDNNYYQERTVASAMAEVDLIKAGETGSPLTFREVSAELVKWSLNENISLDLRVYVAEKAAQMSALSVYCAPTDYLNWLWLGRSQVVMGEWQNSSLCLGRARELRPYWLDVMLFEYK